MKTAASTVGAMAAAVARERAAPGVERSDHGFFIVMPFSITSAAGTSNWFFIAFEI